jgi:tRNA pseudouridine13 synthase
MPASSTSPASDRPCGRIRTTPEDFVVEELPAYTPSGTGEHVFVRFTKRERNTMDAVRDIARACGCDPRAAGHAGMKDRRAVTTQSISLQTPRGTRPADLVARVLGLSLDGITIHEAVPHPHKMKPGHLAGNRFAIVVRGLPEDRLGDFTGALDRVVREGVPNAFGTQRFGTRGDNATQALAWLRGQERGPRDPRVQRLLWSSLQSAVFNAVLDARVEDGTWTLPLEGDLLKLHESGGMFGCADVQTDRDRARAGELSPTGPIIGARMRWPEGAPADLERRVSAQILGGDFDLARTRSLGEGSRRALRLWVQDLRYERLTGAETASNSPGSLGKPEACMRVWFVLPKGAYATTVLAAAAAVEEARSTEGAPGTLTEHGDEGLGVPEAKTNEPASPEDDETDGAIAT